MLSGPDLVTPTDNASRIGGLIAQTTCERLADAIYDSAHSESLWLPGAALAHNRASADALATAESAPHAVRERRKASLLGTPAWSERAIWLGAGLALGLSAIALTLAVVRRISDHEMSGE
jgi:hypothetical protein